MKASLLQATHLYWSPGPQPLLRDISLGLNPGEIVGIIGPNGAGKSSLLRLLAGLEKPNEGECLLSEKPYSDWSSQDFSRKLAYLEQAAHVQWSLTARQVISLGRLPWRRPFQGATEQDQSQVREVLAECGITRLAERPVDTLSAGELALVMLARVLAGTPELIIADEPAAALDLHHQLMLMEILQDLARGHSNTGVLVVLHDLNLAAQWCDRLLLLSGGRLVASGSPEEVLTTEMLRDHYQIEAAIIPGEHGPHIAATRRL